jgi:hypothetical protein
MATWVMPFSEAAHLIAGRSSHPTLLLLPVLATHAPYGLARLVKELRRHRPVADARRVRLGYPNDVLELPSGDAGTDDRTPYGRVRGGDERIGPVVVVEERRLSPFEQDTLPLFERIPE